ncbi:MAG: Maf family nucleotide pyrophosphatase [Bacteroidales bacterium]
MNTLQPAVNIILGSASPRRKELLAGLDLDFVIDTKTNFVEIYPDTIPLAEVPEYLAKGKSNGFHRELQPSELLITADTMVLCNGEMMGKPKDKADAARMLGMLQNNKHTVITGVCLRSCKKMKSFTTTSNVCFGKLSAQEIDYYLEKYKPYDKAGAYGVQEWIGYVGITGLEGSYYNVMGLPVQRLYAELKQF